MTSVCIFKVTLRNNTQVFLISQSSIFQFVYELSTSNVTNDHLTSSIQYHTAKTSKVFAFHEGCLLPLTLLQSFSQIIFSMSVVASTFHRFQISLLEKDERQLLQLDGLRHFLCGTILNRAEPSNEKNHWNIKLKRTIRSTCGRTHELVIRSVSGAPTDYNPFGFWRNNYPSMGTERPDSKVPPIFNDLN